MVAKRVSVVIPAYNAAKTLPPLMRSLRAQTHPPHEVVVVDDVSADDTAAVARELGARVVSHTVNRGPGIARNTGAEAAEGDVLAFTDADCIVPLDWIERSLAFMERWEVDATTSGYVGPVHTDLSSWFQHLEKALREPAEPTPIRAVNGHSLVIDRRLFFEVGGMPDMRISEDFLFGLRVSSRTKLLFDPENGVYHHFRPGARSVFRQKMSFALNSVKVVGDEPLDMGQDATFSPWKVLGELALTACAIGTLPLPPVSIGFLTLRSLPFLLQVRREGGSAELPLADEGPREVPGLLYAYSVPQLVVGDVGTIAGAVRGYGSRLLRRLTGR